MWRDHELVITPDHEPHKQLETDVAEFLESLDFAVEEMTYHDKMSDLVRERLSHIYTPTSLYLRGRADRSAIHRTKQIVFEWEAKTHGGSKYHNMALEAMPFIHHLTRAQHCVRCLYCYRDPERGYECGFWIEKHPPIWQIKVPSRWNGNLKFWFEQQFEMFLSDIPVMNLNGTGGSDDPFLLIKENDVQQLPGWKDLILDVVNGNKQ
jgi:hypothetical protein